MSKKPIPPSQLEISNNLTNGEPTNNNLRANQVSLKGDDVKPFSIGLEDIDSAIMFHIQNKIKPFVIQNGERLTVPSIYGSPEKWKSYQKDGYIRDNQGGLMLPLIMFKRENIERIKTNSNKLDANFPNNTSISVKKYSPKNTYNNFDILNNIKPQESYYITVIPDYISISYTCVIQTYYVAQLNNLIEQMTYAADSYWGDPERFKFKVTIDNFNTITELQQSDNRLVSVNFSFILTGYIIPDVIQKDITIAKKFNNKTTITIQEHIK